MRRDILFGLFTLASVAGPLEAQRWPAEVNFQSQLADGLQLGAHVRTAPDNPTSLLLSGAGPVQQNCPECNQQRQFWSGAYQLTIVQLIPWSVNRFLRGLEFAEVSPSTWWTNLENPWVWDNNEFLNNQFSHPYHGSLYYNAGRANGYNFWESMLWAGGGSLMWELMGESWAPAPNDWWNTTLGGISLGEMLWRVSSLTLDNESSGFERGMRETAATLMNPVRGWNRLIRGHTTGQRENPEEWRPQKVFAAFDFGYRAGADFADPGSKNEQFTAQMLLSYGDRIEDADGKPFSTFLVELTLASNQGSAGALNTLTANGNLWGTRLVDEENKVVMIGVQMTYEYQNSIGFQFGGQGFHVGPIFRFGDRRGLRFQGRFMGTFMPITSVRSDYFVTLEGRDYDYGPGFGGWTTFGLVYEGKFWLVANARLLYTPVISGFNGDHFQRGAWLEARGYLWGRVGAGARYTVFRRNSHYSDFPDVATESGQFRLFASLAVPRWVP